MYYIIDKFMKLREEQKKKLDAGTHIGDLITVNLTQVEVVTKHTYITYIPLTLDPRRGSKGVSDNPPRRPRFTNIT
jgi:hypothetical protein